MSSIEPLLIIYDHPIIKPKPKRIHKIQNNMPKNTNDLFTKKSLKSKSLRINNQQENCGNKIKKKNSEKLSFNLDLISLEEIENDFNDFKSKTEEIEEQKEILYLLKKANNNNSCRNIRKYKRPENPICKNFEFII